MPTVNGIQFDREVELNVSDGDEVTGPIRSVISSGTLVRVPPGEYVINGGVDMPSRSGIIGTPTDPAATVLRAPRGKSVMWASADGGSQHLINGFTLDQRQDDITSVTTLMQSDDRGKCLNVHLRGDHPPDEEAAPNGHEGHSRSTHPNAFLIATNNTSGVNLYRDILIDGYGHRERYSGNRNAFWISNSHDGTVRLERVHVENCGSNAIYGSRNHGAVQVYDSKFKNCDRSHTRISGTVNSGAQRTEIVGCQYHFNFREVGTDWGSYIRAVGIEVEFGWRLSDATPEHPYIADCDFYMEDVSQVQGVPGAIEFRNMNHGRPPGGIIENCRFRNDTSEDVLSFQARQGNDAIDMFGCHVSGNTSVGSTWGAISFEGGAWCGPEPSGISFSGNAASGCTQPDVSGTPVDWGGCDSDADCPDCMVCRDPPDGACVDDPACTTVAITNAGGSRTTYEATVDGEVVSTSGFGTGDSVDRSGDYPVVSGFVNGGEDAFTYNGCIRAFTYDGMEPTITLDGQQTIPGDVVECPPDPVSPCEATDCPPETPHCIVQSGEAVCVECIRSDHCPGDKVCEDNTCVDPPTPPGDGLARAALVVVGTGLGLSVLRDYLRNRR